MPRKRKGKKSKSKREMLPFLSTDKGFEERWTAGRDPMQLVKPIRIVLSGAPSTGKTRTAKNIILKGGFDSVFVLHEDPNTTEYDCCGATILNCLPENEFWMRGGHSEDSESESESDSDDEEYKKKRKPICLVIDDICYASNFNKVQSARLNRVCGFISSHFNVSLIMCSQDFTELPAIARRCANYFVIWRPTCLDNLNTIGRRVGYTSQQMRDLFNNHVKEYEDSIMFDRSVRSPFPLRLNFYTMLKMDEI